MKFLKSTKNKVKAVEVVLFLLVSAVILGVVSAGAVDKTERAVEPVEIVYDMEWADIGEFKLTAYCACEKCCGVYGKNRPTRADGTPVVYTANMSEAKQGLTVAADTDVLPYGTRIMMNDHVYEVQDCGGAVRGNHIDVYFESHQEALEFGVQSAEVFVERKY